MLKFSTWQQRIVPFPLFPLWLTSLYLLVLGLGFRGEKDDSYIEMYKKKLFRLLYPTYRSMFANEDKSLVPQVFRYTHEVGSYRFLPDVSKWLKIFTLCIVVYLVASAFLWYWIQSDVEKSIKPLINKIRIINEL